MEIKIAKTAGFCMGVRRAIDLTLALAKSSSPVYTFGPLIHNPQLLELLAEKGVFILDHIPEKGSGTVVIRAHGVSPFVVSKLRVAGFGLVDATCPRVTKVQKVIRRNTCGGCAVIIVGDKNHSEVRGLVGYAQSDVYVVEDVFGFSKLSLFEKAIVVAQTTQNISLYTNVKQWIIENELRYNCFDTICYSTIKRQAEVESLSKCVDLIIVVGGKQSGNTARLKEVAKTSGNWVLQIETEADLNFCSLPLSIDKIGIVGGASTPNWIVQKVYNAIKLFYSS